ncbi:hypothetical protein DINM_001545 [Dirofilaria immitis]|nr:hypothetical protein [Dirofilaria immitis]
MYMSEISNGMRYLERKGCIHRDLAARNILISNTGWLKISDFGLSLNSSSLMAPETLTHTPIYSSKSDIWSFGIVMYEIFNCGRKPWPQKPVKWIATKIRKGVTPEMPKRMPRLVREIASACFQVEPDKRPTFRQPIKFIENDPEVIAIELDEQQQQKQHDDDDSKLKIMQLSTIKRLVPITSKNIIMEEHDKIKKVAETESDDDYKGSRDNKKSSEERQEKVIRSITYKRKRTRIEKRNNCIGRL